MKRTLVVLGRSPVFNNPPFFNPTYHALFSNGDALKADGAAVNAALVKLPLEFDATLIDFIALLVLFELLVNSLFASLS